ncbi:MAG: Hpt domain-containing protein [Bdellovibrionales bacterium]|nr:Hpt domain-containing protein [Bdellovibrionales bacterium]
MVDFSVFDSILDAAFVVDQDGKIVYCNDAGATFVQSSIRRLVGKALLSDLITVTEAGILPFNDSSQGRTSPTPFIETEFSVPKAAKSGKAQLAVRPIEGGHWVFFVRDVSLEEALHSKYRSELAQKEDYARNLEKLVEARTAELRDVNQTLNAILDSLGQGFFTFNAAGDCGNVYTKACEVILEGVPKERKAWDVLGVRGGDQDQFRKWMETMFSELLPFEDLKGLGPNIFPHSQSKHVVLEYYPIRREENAIRDIVVVATDKTAERQAQIALETERQFASMVVKYMKNKEQFLQFLASVRQSIAQLKALTQKSLDDKAINESFRILHTLEGEAGTFSLRELRASSRVSQHVLEPYKGQSTMPDPAKAEYVQSLNAIEVGFENFLVENKGIFKISEGEAARVVEVPADSVAQFMAELQRTSGAALLLRRYQELFLRVPLEDRLKYFDGLIQSVAERLNKKVKPLQIDSADLRIYPEPYQKFFSALVHAFRNAVDHGLEEPEEREWGGKDPAGQIRVHARLSEGRLQMTVSDDGKGIDPAVIRTKLKEKFPDRDFSAQSDAEIIQNVCMPGFSSRDAVGEFSGRGVGLDALREEVLKLGGSLVLKSEVGKGTTIEIGLPELGFDSATVLRSA